MQKIKDFLKNILTLGPTVPGGPDGPLNPSGPCHGNNLTINIIKKHNNNFTCGKQTT